MVFLQWRERSSPPVEIFGKSSYPKLTNITAANVPALLDEELLNLLELPDDVSVSHVCREKQTSELGQFFTGKIRIPIKIENTEQETVLRGHYGVKNRLGNEIPASIPFLHECYLCKQKGRQKRRGHDELWCKIKRNRTISARQEKLHRDSK